MNYTKLFLLLLLPVTVPAANIVNGSFETGNLMGWTVGGFAAENAQVLTSADTGNVLPASDGKNFAILSTGPGLINAEGQQSTTLTSSPFDVTGQGMTLSFFIDFLTAENIDGTGNPDSFSVQILGQADKTVASGTVKNGYPPNLIVPGGYLGFPDGTAVIYDTGINKISTSLNAFVGQSITVQFQVQNGAQEDGVDSALYVDGVSVSPAPEPPLWYATAIVLLFFVARVCSRRRIIN
jgi:hypothetical protein